MVKLTSLGSGIAIKKRKLKVGIENEPKYPVNPMGLLIFNFTNIRCCSV